jgi:DNA (cytosine-5)-methyltransferase 1
MALVIAGLRECWPVVGWRILDSRYFGVAQRRRRVFFVCGPTEAGVAKVLALTEGGAGDPEAGGEAGAHVAHAISAGAGGSKFGSGRDGQDDFVIADPLTSSYAKHGGAAAGKDSTPRNIVTGQCHGGNVGPMGTLRKGNGDVTGGVPFVAASEPFTLASRGRGDTHQLEVRQDGLANAILTPNGGRGGIGVGAIAHALTGEGHDASEDGTGRGTPMVVAFHEDQRTGSIYENDHTHALAQPGGKPGQGYQAVREGSAVRRLTPLECERLQSFPDGWTCLCQPLEAYAADPDAAALACACPDSPRYRALGNAVTVNVISWLGQRLKEVMNEQVG